MSRPYAHTEEKEAKRPRSVPGLTLARWGAAATAVVLLNVPPRCSGSQPLARGHASEVAGHSYGHDVGYSIGCPRFDVC